MQSYIWDPRKTEAAVVTSPALLIGTIAVFKSVSQCNQTPFNQHRNMVSWSELVGVELVSQRCEFLFGDQAIATHAAASATAASVAIAPALLQALVWGGALLYVVSRGAKFSLFKPVCVRSPLMFEMRVSMI